jgi:two-component system NtrC family response regulator
VAGIGIVFAASQAVRLTTLSDEHTSIAILPADSAEARATVTVPRSGVELIAVERALIQFALNLHGGNRTHAAAFLGLSRSALLYRMQKYHLDLTPKRPADRESS